MVGPLGFTLDDSQLKRAGLDYWNSVCVKVHDDWPAFHSYWKETLGSPGDLVAFSKFGARPHAEGAYQKGDWLLFGAETTGLPDEAHEACAASGGVRRLSPSTNSTCEVSTWRFPRRWARTGRSRQIDGSPTRANPPRADAPGSYHMSDDA